MHVKENRKEMLVTITSNDRMKRKIIATVVFLLAEVAACGMYFSYQSRKIDMIKVPEAVSSTQSSNIGESIDLFAPIEGASDLAGDIADNTTYDSSGNPVYYAGEVKDDYPGISFDDMMTAYINSGAQVLTYPDDQSGDQNTIGVVGYVVSDYFNKYGITDSYYFDSEKDLISSEGNNICTWHLESDKSAITLTVDFYNQKVHVDKFEYPKGEK